MSERDTREVKELVDAVNAAVAAKKQPAQVAQRVLAWVRAMGRNEVLSREDLEQRFDSIARALKIKGKTGADNEG